MKHILALALLACLSSGACLADTLVIGTVPVATPRLPTDYRLTGDGWRACWYEWQAINSGGYTGSGGGFEIQVVLTVE